MGRPWIKDGKVDKQELDKLFGHVKFGGDAINFIEWVQIFADRLNDLEEQIEKTKKIIKEYEENINADVRIQELKAKLEDARQDLYRGFGISQEESEEITAWKEKHDVERHGLNSLDKKLRAGGTIGGRYHYQFVPTSIGIVGTCVCENCERKAFTEAKGDRELYNELKEKYDAEFTFADL